FPDLPIDYKPNPLHLGSFLHTYRKNNHATTRSFPVNPQYYTRFRFISLRFSPIPIEPKAESLYNSTSASLKRGLWMKGRAVNKLSAFLFWSTFSLCLNAQ